MSRRYETVYIFDSALEEAAVNDRLAKFHALLTKDGKGTISNVSHWGKRTLAYRLKKKDTGYYVVAQYEAAQETLAEYERHVTLDEGVLRFLVVLAAPEVARPAAADADAAVPAVAIADEDVDEEDV